MIKTDIEIPTSNLSSFIQLTESTVEAMILSQFIPSDTMKREEMTQKTTKKRVVNLNDLFEIKAVLLSRLSIG